MEEVVSESIKCRQGGKTGRQQGQESGGRVKERRDCERKGSDEINGWLRKDLRAIQGL